MNATLSFTVVVFVLDRNYMPGYAVPDSSKDPRFIVPGTQLYLPFLGLSLQERFRPAANWNTDASALRRSGPYLRAPALQI